MVLAVDNTSQAARELMKNALRNYGAVTSGLRTGPDFVVIGAKRGGTTSLYNYLLEHPSIQPLFPSRQRVKGPHYFDSEYQRGDRWYRSHFPLEVAGRHLARPTVASAISGEASPYYLFHPLAAQRLASTYPDVKIIVTLRDPVERAYSHYKERVRHGAENLSFEEALAAEPDRLRGEAERIIAEPGYHSPAHEDHSYLAQGRYLDMLPRWFELFGREQFYINASEDFYADPAAIVTEVWSFLGLEPGTLRSRKRHNYHPAQDIRPATRQRLQKEFAGHNTELADLLGRPLPWPASQSESAPASSAAAATADAGSWPSVSVVVATRDRPELLERAVRSILGQDYPGDVECVLVFDQSEPAAVAVPERPGRRIQMLTNTRTPGLAGGRNSGILASDGALIAFCDDDDEWDATKLTRQVAELERTSATFAASGVRIHFADREFVRVPPTSVGIEHLVLNRDPALPSTSFVVRRSAMAELGLVDEEIPGSYGEDYDWLLRAARMGPIVAVAEPLVDVYWHQQSFYAERYQMIIDALEYLLAKHPELAASRPGAARIQGQIAFAHAALGHRKAARKAARQALANNPRERRAYLALAIASRLLSAATVVRLANSRGRGI
jgi:Glycosyl transferase family 2/Sulfotransferase family